TRQLTLARGAHPGAHGDRRFAGSASAHFGMADARHLQLEIDAIEQRPGNPPAVTCYLVGRAPAVAVGVAGMSAWAGIHGRYELEARRKFGLAGGSRNRDLPRFDRLAQDLEDAAVEFGQFIEKQ